MIESHTTTDLSAMVSMFLAGDGMRRRSGSAIDHKKLSLAVIRMFWAFTVPIDGEEPNIADELGLVASDGAVS